MRKILFSLGLALAVTLPYPALALDQFDTESKAQQHCPADVVVWLNLPSGIYHYKGAKYYAHTKHGAFVCEKEAIGAGMRRSKDGS
jgi:hypothetical protein